MGRAGVLLMGFGGPDSLDAVGPFMRNLMGREPSEELVSRVRQRYDAIGGCSPLPAVAGSIAEGLEAELASDDRDVPVRVGMRYWHPYIADGLAELNALGVDRVLTVSLSPFESKVATGAYREAVGAQCECADVLEIAPLHTLGAFASAHARALADALEETPDSLVAFSAHSLPLEDLDSDDEYVSGLRRTADAVAGSLGWSQGSPDGFTAGDVVAYGTNSAPQAWALVYQSKGQRPGAWLGPDLDDLIAAAGSQGVPSMVVCPIGFVTDHMETLYDLDIVAAEQAKNAGVEFSRAAVPNADRELVAAIADAVRAAL